MTPTLHLGDCRDVLATVPDASIDAVVTDPPYGLGKAPDALAMLRDWLDTGHYDVKGRGFMGREWDAFVPQPVLWREVYRVMKPGAHLVAFAGTRTQDLMGLALRIAGFEIRDCLSWLYKTGFPKSLDVSKAIDQARIEDEGAVRAVCRAVRAAMERAGLTSKVIADRLGYHSRLIDHFAARDTDSQPEIASSARWRDLVAILPELEAVSPEVDRLNARKGDYGETWKAAEVIGEHDGRLAGLAGERFNAVDRTIRAPSDAARQWEGWGTALKPAYEPIILARKPLIGTVTANVQTHGTGGINIDACRIESSTPTATFERHAGDRNRERYRTGTTGERSQSAQGRWPANVCLDEIAAAMLDAEVGETVTGAWDGVRNLPKTRGVYGDFAQVGDTSRARPADRGGASRFFYTAKASSAERKLEDGSRNTHCTVKPTDLMKWLVRLVTPPGGVVLDPFMGSGSTGVACAEEGFRFIGIEREAEYHAIALKRLDAATRQGRLDL